MLISIHIPKTAGTTFFVLLSTIYEDKILRDYGDNVLAFNYKPIKFTLNPFDKLNLRIYKQLFSKKCIHGHFLFEKYAYVPNAKFITWVRDPVQRLLSHYYYWQKYPDPSNDLCVYVHDNKLSLLDFAKLNRLQNVQKYYLSNQPTERFAFIGVSEYFKESIQTFNTTFSHDLPLDLKMNVNPDAYDIEPSVLSKIRDLNLEDVKLYEAVLKRYA